MKTVIHSLIVEYPSKRAFEQAAYPWAARRKAFKETIEQAKIIIKAHIEKAFRVRTTRIYIKNVGNGAVEVWCKAREMSQNEKTTQITIDYLNKNYTADKIFPEAKK